jgi:hypothetical protein
MRPPGYRGPTSADLRRAVEVRIVIFLAGHYGEHFGPPFSGFAAPDPDPLEAERLARRLTELSPRHRELLIRTAAHIDSHESTDDDSSAFRHAQMLGADDEAGAHLVWLTTVARRLVYDNSFAVQRIAEALLERTVLTGEEVAAAALPRKESTT